MSEGVAATSPEITPLRSVIRGRDGVLYQNSMTYKGLEVTEYVLQLDKEKPSELTIVWVRDNRWDVMQDRGVAYPMFKEVFTLPEIHKPGNLWQSGPVCTARSRVCAKFEDFYREHLKG